MPVTTASAAVQIAPVVVKTFVNHKRRKAKKAKENAEDDAKDEIFFDQAFHIVKGVLIEWFGPEELQYVVGGERWWQVRGLDGIDAEWITEKKYLSPELPPTNRKLSDDEAKVLKMDHLETIMSVRTLTLDKLYIHGGSGTKNSVENKLTGQCIGGYFWGSINFYLIEPPPGALHKPIPPSKIVLAGDSAGGGLCLTMLTILRDLGLPMPAGAVLISPWVDLTHSFPSILENSKTDIIPQHGFLAKPSTLWPVESLPQGDGRVVCSKSNGPPQPGRSDTLKPSYSRVDNVDNGGDITMSGEKVQNQREMYEDVTEDTTTPSSGDSPEQSVDEYNIDFWEPKPPKVLMDDPDAVPLELRAQIQLYATTEQLSHPLVSPVLQGSLGNLPPLYILAGNDEVLRDEIIYMAHRASHPSKYPTRHGVLRDGHRQRENAEKFITPTKVHLQVFDGMCHVLTVFTFTPSAKCAYESISEFVRQVTNQDPRFQLSDKVFERNMAKDRPSNWKASVRNHRNVKHNAADVSEEIEYDGKGPVHEDPVHEFLSYEDQTCQMKEAGNAVMIRKRIDVNGVSRNMEPPGEIEALNLPPGQIGLIKEGPTRRWLEGQEEWDKRFRRSAKKVNKRKLKLEAKAARIISNARLQGLILDKDATTGNLQESISRVSHSNIDRIQEDRRWGPLDLDDERPPPSAIAKRRDTPEALALLKKSIYHTAPVTHKTVPRLRVSDAIRAIFDPNDDPNRPPRQSVSEQQVQTHIIPIHGLRMWDGIVR
ncbi:hypothetical protein H0H81_005059 [Sphagnurus paluster]|uniref:Alpha/beta hydrolase fold-3 domain-containing protein n=1 Tax=Sphagnurus paluster TaxID=117069 RepID=A0A9P7KMB6_9AGAR|nr:hypothetical protein H0H81_005059 [Sphagnurus paluster]